ncbi:hypothetical protein PRZ48_009535 [Zasmidium cellare]|uniref:BTB domain-containing protein n=1 Tax=Zasmidium cellare TaxID=395010 RepID=A0ABR0ECT7_ZASCE|nr:hypothetical protein PRZ48_009535 [Zasmidium cellare]
MADDKTKRAVYSAMGRFYNSKDLSDFIITSNGSTWNVHRLLLCLHSDVFAKWFTGGFEYNIQGLKLLSTSYFQDLIDAELQPYDLAAAVAVAYEAPGATSAIREVLVAEIVGNQQHFLPNEPAEDSEELEEAISAYPEFALEIIKAKGNRQGTEERKWLEYKCPKCRGSFQAPYSEKHDVLYACRFCTASMDGKSWQKHVRPYI